MIDRAYITHLHHMIETHLKSVQNALDDDNFEAAYIISLDIKTNARDMINCLALAKSNSRLAQRSLPFRVGDKVRASRTTAGVLKEAEDDWAIIQNERGVLYSVLIDQLVMDV